MCISQNQESVKKTTEMEQNPREFVVNTESLK